MKRLAALCSIMALAVVGATGDVVADQVSVYTAKFVCGDGGFSSATPSQAGGVTNAFYRTAVNIANPNNRGVTLHLQVVLTEARSVTGVTDVVGSAPQAPQGEIVDVSLSSRGAVEWDCDQLGELLNCPSHDFSSGGFAKGFLIVSSDADGTLSNAPVNVVGVYTTIGKLAGDKGTSIDIEEVQGRRINDTDNQIAADHHEDGN